MKIAVIGNCQAGQLAASLNALVPGAAAEKVTLRTHADSLGEVAQQNDLVLAQPHARPQLETLPPALRDKVTLWPRIYFPAFQPDALSARGRIETNPTGPGRMSSQIALIGWFAGLSASETIALFREEVFARLGYFDQWDRAKRLLLEECGSHGVDLAAPLETWAKSACFMYLPRHPKGFVIFEIARQIAGRLGLAMQDVPEAERPDVQAGRSIWPVYPEIAERYGLKGNYDYVTPDRGGQRCVLPLEQFIVRSLEHYAKAPPDKTEFPELAHEPLADLIPRSRKAIAGGQSSAPRNPYDKLPDHRFWRRSVERVAPDLVDPVIAAPFKIDRDAKLATAGSCFAQHISRTLSARGFGYMVAEAPPADMPEAQAKALNYGVFSARYGNIYTARQLLQLFDRAFGSFPVAEKAWKRADGRLVDPYRPQIEPDGFESPEALRAARAQHLSAVRRMFRQLDVFVFTLGLTEAWRSKKDGAVFPLAPGVAGGTMDDQRYEFVNFSVHDVTADLAAFVEKLRAVNHDAKIILTVSPVPLVATYEDRHVLVSTTYSKSVLRVAAEETAAAFPDVWYFPSYEIITGAFNRGGYFEADLRSVTPQGVDHVMRLFVAHGTAGGAGESKVLAAGEADERHKDAEMRKGFEIVCEEELLEPPSEPRSRADARTGDATPAP